jgi:hypothetical protein
VCVALDQLVYALWVVAQCQKSKRS